MISFTFVDCVWERERERECVRDKDTERESGRVELGGGRGSAKKSLKSPLKNYERNVKFEKFIEIEAKQSFCNLMPACPPIQKYWGGKYII